MKRLIVCETIATNGGIARNESMAALVSLWRLIRTVVGSDQSLVVVPEEIELIMRFMQNN